MDMSLFISWSILIFFRSYTREMGDSDDEYDNRRNRDKFRRERDDFGGNRPNNNRGGGGDWNDGR
jgi:hypothetical protein